MDFNTLTRDSEQVMKAMTYVGDQLVAVKPVKVVFPERFVERGLASTAGDKYALGMCAVVSDNYYGVIKACALIPYTPTEIERIKKIGRAHV